MEEVSEACTSHLEGSITRSLQTDGDWTLVDASISEELLAVRPRPWHLPEPEPVVLWVRSGPGKGPLGCGEQGWHMGSAWGGGISSGASAT